MPKEPGSISFGMRFPQRSMKSRHNLNSPKPVCTFFASALEEFGFRNPPFRWTHGSDTPRIAHADATLTFPQTVVLRYTLQAFENHVRRSQWFWSVVFGDLLNVFLVRRDPLAAISKCFKNIIVTWCRFLGVAFGFQTWPSWTNK